MGKQDIITKDYLNDPRIFADAFNFYLYNGEPVINPQNLKPLDSSLTAIPYGDRKHPVTLQKNRDVIKSFSGMRNEEAILLLLGVEAQSDIHYAMPVKDMLYDSMQYAGQVTGTARLHREKTSGEKNPSSGEFLSGFYKEDKLIPVITLVIYFGPDKWDGPMSLHEMLLTTDQQLLSHIPDYKINLITPDALEEEAFEKFHTSFREVLKFIKYSKDKEKLKSLTESDPHFRHIEKEAYHVISAMTGVEVNLKESEDYIDMCQAIREMCEDAKQEGFASGQKEGFASGQKEGFISGQKEGFASGQKQAVKILRLLNQKAFSYEEIAALADTSVEQVKSVERDYTS